MYFFSITFSSDIFKFSIPSQLILKFSLAQKKNQSKMYSHTYDR